MNKVDKQRLAKVIEGANELMDGPALVVASITNADVVEAMLADMASVASGREPRAVAELVARDRLAG